MKRAEEGPIELAGRRQRLELAVAAGWAERAHDLDDTGFPTLFSAPSDRLRRFLETFDRAVVWMRDDDGRIRSGLEACGLRDAVVAPGLPPSNWSRHASEYYFESLGYPGPPPPFRLSIAPATVRHDVLIHPGSGGERKNWPVDRFRAVADALRGQGRQVEWIRGPAEEGLALPDAKAALPEMPLVDLATHLAAARLYLGNDSGVTHLAAAVGCPTVAVFGPTNPRVWAPRGSHVQVVHGEPWPEVKEVLRAVSSAAAAEG